MNITQKQLYTKVNNIKIIAIRTFFEMIFSISMNHNKKHIFFIFIEIKKKIVRLVTILIKS